MEALKIEILNPKALRLIEGMQDLKLIKIEKDEQISALKKYLKKMRQHSDSAPSTEEISGFVKEARAERYAKK